MGPRRRIPDRLSRRLRPRRGGRPGGVRARCRALAPRRSAGEPARVADHNRTEPRDRPHPPGPNARSQDAAARCAGGDGGRDGRDDDCRRAPGARLHVLPPRARARCAGRADPAHAGRPEHGGDRTCVPRPAGDDGQAPRARQEEDPRRGHPVPSATAASAARPARRGPRRRLPRLQRGLRRPGRPRDGGVEARRRPRGAPSRRARGARARRADADQRCAARGALRRR